MSVHYCLGPPLMGIFSTQFPLVDVWNRWEALTKAVAHFYANTLSILPSKKAEEGCEKTVKYMLFSNSEPRSLTLLVNQGLS